MGDAHYLQNGGMRAAFRIVKTSPHGLKPHFAFHPYRHASARLKSCPSVNRCIRDAKIESLRRRAACGLGVLSSISGNLFVV